MKKLIVGFVATLALGFVFTSGPAPAEAGLLKKIFKCPKGYQREGAICRKKCTGELSRHSGNLCKKKGSFKTGGFLSKSSCKKGGYTCSRPGDNLFPFSKALKWNTKLYYRKCNTSTHSLVKILPMTYLCIKKSASCSKNGQSNYALDKLYCLRKAK